MAKQAKNTTDQTIKELEKRVEKMPEGPTKENMKRDLQLKKNKTVTK